MPEQNTPHAVRFHEVAPAIEFVCWIVVLLVPLLRIINGPAVSSDQFTIQIVLTIAAIAGGLGLRVYQIICN